MSSRRQRLSTENDLERKLWIDRNEISEKNIPYISSLLKYFQVGAWNEVIDWEYGNAIIVNVGLKTYKIVIDKSDLCLRLGERNQVGNTKLLEKYHVVTTAGDNGCFYGESPWESLVTYLSRRRR